MARFYSMLMADGKNGFSLSVVRDKLNILNWRV